MQLLADTKTFEMPDYVRRAAELALERKAQDVVVLDLRGISSATDFFLLASGSSDVQVRAVAEHIRDELKSEECARPDHVEGLRAGSWVLLRTGPGGRTEARCRTRTGTP